MIVSASYKTDIPAFYGTWFANRLRDGECSVANPYGGKPFTVSLRRADVDGFIFWTRNAGPFTGILEDLAAKQWPFIVQFTVTGYSRELDAATISADQAIEQIIQLRDKFGLNVPVWRYDPIVLTSATPAPWHLENFSALAERLTGSVNEVVVSFMQLYRKTQRNLDLSAQAHEFSWHDPEPGEKRALVKSLAAIAASRDIKLTLCGQPDLLSADVGDARCIDETRLSAVAGKAITAGSKSHRKTCACAASRDIGAYDSCPHGCTYCYAVKDRETAKAHFNAHDPSSVMLS